MRNPFCRPNSFHVSFTATITPEASRITALTGSAFKALNASTRLFMSKHQAQQGALFSTTLYLPTPLLQSRYHRVPATVLGTPPQQHKNSRFGLLFEVNPI
jgi:hypothetical protein